MKQHKRKIGRRILWGLVVFLSCLLILSAFLAYYSAQWYVNTYGQLSFDSILFTLLSDLNGVESTLISDYIRAALVPALLLVIPLCLLLFLPWRKRLVLWIKPKIRLRLFPVYRVIALLVTLGLSSGLMYNAADTTELLDYIKYLSQESTIYQENYRDPATVNITFPEKKRNVIYLFLESMETTIFSTEQGGVLDTCLVPELYALAQDNVNFSTTDKVGGLQCGSGSIWTVGAMVTQTAGIPLKVPPSLDGNDYGGEGVFLPGATTMMDILHKNGYYQALMVGSDAQFGGRETYFTSHGVDKIYDLFTARTDGLIPPDYQVWWGFEDLNLYRYAKQELTNISQMEQPFAFYMLTADTHHIGGYVCPNCENTRENPYENVYSCASRQVQDFIDWIREQDFYEDTAIVIVGDHPSMDHGYIESINGHSHSRTAYNCFINSAVQPAQTRNRAAYTIDLFPTILAAMGCTIDGDRLGLGTNLFSDVPTYGEHMGFDIFDNELKKTSSYYTNHFFFGN